jgi:hypothetical protein
VASEEVESLRLEVAELRTSINARLDTIHKAVLNLSGRAYIPRPPAWKRAAVWLGLTKLD